MNALFLTQGSSLDMSYNLMKSMKDFMTLNKVGFYVADSRFFRQFKQKYPEIESGLFHLLKEWEIIRESRDIEPNISLLERYEKEIGQPYLWNALVADRRIYFGKKYAYTQDYPPRYTHERMMAILQVGLKRMESFFNEIQPDFVVSFICVTLGDYISYLFAQARSIPVFNLRPTRVRNYFYAGESILEPSERLNKTYLTFFKNGIEPALKREASKYLEEVRSTHSMYEGVVPTSNKPPGNRHLLKNPFSLLKVTSLIRLLIGEYRYRFGEYRNDNQISGYIGPFVGQRIIRPLRARLMERQFRNLYIRAKDLSLLNYAFFPLHPEPEVTLGVYSKAYLNQIETTRLFSHNLPVGMKLVVKEHPWAIGKRPLSYYRKLLEIPNVMLAHPTMRSRELISNARLVTIIAGSIGLEALILKKPVVVLGRTPYNFLPNSMIRYSDSPDRLGNDIRHLLENYGYNEKALLSYIAAAMKDSVPVDFYSKLLDRKGVYSSGSIEGDSDSKESERIKHTHLLAQYLWRRLDEIKSP